MTEAAVVLLVLVASLGGGLLLYWAVRAEGGGRQTMHRADAEREARRDTGEVEAYSRSDGPRE